MYGRPPKPRKPPKRPAPPPLDPDIVEQFERAFSSGGGGCRRDCECGHVWFNDENSWSWDDGELEDLRARAQRGEATAVDYTVGTLILDGREYVQACACWHARAAAVVQWLDNHDDAVAEFLTLEKKRLQRIADRKRTVETT